MVESLVRGMIQSFLIVVAGSSSAWADGADYVVDADTLVYGGSHFWSRTQNPRDTRTLYAERLRAGGREVLLQSDGTLSDIKAAPVGNLVGVRAGLWEENVSPQRATYIDRRVDEQGRIVEAFYFEESRLVVLNVDGTIVDTIVGVRRYAWDPTGSHIVYITGTYREGEFGFTTTGTWTHDLSSKRSERIHSGGVDVQWAGWDGNIYIYDPSGQNDSNVLRFDPQTRALAATRRKGIHFSPDGTYYYAHGSEGAGVKVFLTEDDAQVQVDLATPAERTRWAQPSGWLDEKTLIAKVQASDYLYDIETKTTLRATGTVVPLRSRNNRMFLLEGSAVVQRAKSELEVLQE